MNVLPRLRLTIFKILCAALFWGWLETKALFGTIRNLFNKENALTKKIFVCFFVAVPLVCAAQLWCTLCITVVSAFLWRCVWVSSSDKRERQVDFDESIGKNNELAADRAFKKMYFCPFYGCIWWWCNVMRSSSLWNVQFFIFGY